MTNGKLKSVKVHNSSCALALPWHGLWAALLPGMEAEPPGEHYLAEPINEGRIINT